jgi:hypothetical protein
VKFLYTVLIVLVLTLCIFTLHNYFNKKNYISQSNPYESKLLGMEGEILYNNAQLQWITEGSILDPNLTVESANSNPINLSTIIGNKKRIILRFSDRNCMSCIEAQLGLISNLKNTFEKEDILLLASADIKRNIIIKLKQFDIENPIYFTDYNIAGINLERYNVPYYFVTDTNLTMDLVFIPAKEIPTLSENYLSFIKKKLEDNS